MNNFKHTFFKITFISLTIIGLGVFGLWIYNLSDVIKALHIWKVISLFVSPIFISFSSWVLTKVFKILRKYAKAAEKLHEIKLEAQLEADKQTMKDKIAFQTHQTRQKLTTEAQKLNNIEKEKRLHEQQTHKSEIKNLSQNFSKLNLFQNKEDNHE